MRDVKRQRFAADPQIDFQTIAFENLVVYLVGRGKCGIEEVEIAVG